jgi:hypothetical protein
VYYHSDRATDNHWLNDFQIATLPSKVLVEAPLDEGLGISR